MSPHVPIRPQGAEKQQMKVNVVGDGMSICSGWFHHQCDGRRQMLAVQSSNVADTELTTRKEARQSWGLILKVEGQKSENVGGGSGNCSGQSGGIQVSSEQSTRSDQAINLVFVTYFELFTRLGEKIGVVLVTQSLSINNQGSFDWPRGE